MSFKSILAGVTVAVAFAGSAFAADCKLEGDALAGKTVAGQCKSCHELAAGKPSRPTGPSLHDAVGRKAGAAADYTKYSDAMKAANAKGLVWDEAKVAEYVQDPKAFLTKTNGAEQKHGMFFQLKDAAKAKQVAAYLKAISGQACE